MASSRSLFSSNSSYDSGNFTYSGCTDEGCWNLSPPITIPPLPNQTDPDPAKIHIHHSSRLLLYSLVAAASLFALSFILLLISYFLLRLRRRRRHRRRLLQSNSQIQNHPPPFPFQDPDLLDGDDGDGGTHHIWYIRTVGLDESVIKSIAAAVYKSGDGLIDGGDCTVCLGEFVEGEVIKLLPKCSHAFHQSCIDMWLRSHVNCPLCRAPVVVVGPAESEGSVSGAVAVASEETAPVTNGEGGGEEECVVVVDLEAGSSSSNSRREGAENDNENENELQPIRRSVSMDSSSLGVLMLRVHLTEEEEKLGEEKKQAELQGAAASKNGGKGSESFRKWGMEMKRSLSSRSGRMFFTRNARARGRSSSVLPL